MLTDIMKRILILAVFATFLAACTSTTEEPAPVDEPVVEEPVEEPVVMDEPEPMPLETTVYFDFDQSIINAEGRALLSAHAERLKDSGASVRIEGHCDERGTREYNMALGERRANAVRDFLVLQGVSRSSIETVSYGEERPANSMSSESAWAQNRRAEIVL
jgi:peptidoglycan-associated lipoprotein